MTQGPPHSVVLRRVFPASAADVYEAWTTPEIMRYWLAPGPNAVISIDADVSVGGAFRIRSQAPDGVIHTIDGKYRQLHPGRRIVMTWAYSGPIALIRNMETLIEVDFEQIAAGNTAMTFTQSQFASTEAADAYAGDWPSCFAKLECAVSAPADKKSKDQN
jgi:uncharacterized protein YndB with AHSA1/START domain